MSARPLLVADLFCGAGGSSTGAAHAIESMGRTMQLVAVNHWPIAIETHAANHPTAAHYCFDLDSARPEELVPGGKLDLLLASPECSHHSRAYGGRPINDQRRTSAWHIPRWAERLYIRRLIVENVPEFLEWGPLDRRGRPLKSKRGETFKAWVAALESLRYRVEWRILNAADYGDATTRQRLFVMARRDGRRLIWPVATHARDGNSLFGEREKWRAAREVIDWSLPGTSIFERTKPLSPNTLRRIEAGIRRYCRGAVAEAFIVVLRRHADARSLGDPLPTVTAGGTHLGLAEPTLHPFTVNMKGQSTARDIEEPLPTITAHARHVAVAESTLRPFLCANRTNNVPKSVDEPVPVATTTTGGGIFIAEPTAFVLGQQSNAAPRDTEQPLPTIATAGKISVVEPFMVEVNHAGDRAARTLDEPIPTVTTKRSQAIIEPFIVTYERDAKRAPATPRAVEDPLPTVVSRDRFGIAQPFLVAHFGERLGQAPRTHDVDAPLPTVTQRGAGDLVETVIVEESGPADRIVMIDGVPHVLDIRFRMLQPHELAAAMGFPSEYVFTGTKEAVTKQIGNAVPVNLSRALVEAALSDLHRTAEVA